MKPRITAIHLLSLLLLLVLPLYCQAVQKPEIDISLSTDSLTITAYSADIYLRIGGPDGYFLELRGSDYLEWSPDAGATDGNYRYDCYVSSGVPRDGSISEEAMEEALKASSSSSHGEFQVENGRLLGDDEAPGESPDDSLLPDLLGISTSHSDARNHNFWSAIGGLLNVLVSPAHALDTVNDDMQVNGYLDVRGNLYDGAGTLIMNDSARVTGTLDVRGNFFDGAGVLTLNDDVQVNGYINATGANGGYFNYSDSTNNLSVSGGDFYLFSETPQIYFYDTTTTDYNWYIDANDNSFKIRDTVDANNNIVIQVDALGGSTNLANSIVINTLGDIGLADSAVFIDRSADEVGIGTLSPAGSLHILDDALPELILEDSGAGSTRWELEASTAELHVYGYNSTSFTSVYPLRINNDAKSNTLVLGNLSSGTNNIGMGTNDPETGLHMLHFDGNGIIKVQENNATAIRRYQLQLENNGRTGILMTDTSPEGRSWEFAHTMNGGFTFSDVNTDGSEFVIRSDGQVSMGPGSVTNFLLFADGNLLIPNGAVTATAFNTSSSRNVKKNFRRIDEAEILRKLGALEITEWEYKDPDVSGRHVGPVAEEFHALFGLGESEKHVSPTDMASIGLVAAKQLNTRLDSELSALRGENAELRAGNEKLQQRLSELEALIAKLLAD